MEVWELDMIYFQKDFIIPRLSLSLFKISLISFNQTTKNIDIPNAANVRVYLRYLPLIFVGKLLVYYANSS